MTDKPGHKSLAAKPAKRRPNFIPQTPNYLQYNWLDRDPDLDLILGLIGESGLSPEDIELETSKLGWKVSRYTILSWMFKGTRRPQNYTMTIVALALGYTKTWTANRADVTAIQPAKPVRRAQEARSHVHH